MESTLPQSAATIGANPRPLAIANWLLFVAGLVFMRVVDRPARQVWFAAGTALIVVAWALPALFGPGEFTLVAVMLVSGLGNAFAGESIYKIWSQELFPTLLRATATGVTMAFTRALAGLAALGTPALALGHSGLFFGLLLGATVVHVDGVPTDVATVRAVDEVMRGLLAVVMAAECVTDLTTARR